MATKKPLDGLRGAKDLVHDAVDATAELVREGHDSAARMARRVTDAVEPIRGPAAKVDAVRKLGTDAVIDTVKAANRLVRAVGDAGLVAFEDEVDEEGALLPMRSDVVGGRPFLVDGALGLVNAAVGDHLDATENPLALEMKLRVEDRYLDPDALGLGAPPGKVAVFVHGLATTEWSWCLGAEDYYEDPSVTFGTQLAADLGFLPVYARYNGGRSVPDNGRDLALLLERFVRAYPTPIEDLTLICHSMGGLVTRSAASYAMKDDLRWPSLVRRAFYLGSPHQGAPLAKLGRALTTGLGRVDLPATQVISRVLGGRSQGVKDLSDGVTLDPDWSTRDPAAADPATRLIPDATHYFVSASVTRSERHPVGQIMGDLLVRVPSASAPRHDVRAFEIETRGYGGLMHHQLQNHPSVYAQIRDACASTPGTVAEDAS